MKDVLVKGEWFKDIKNLPKDIQDKVISDVIRCAFGDAREYRDDVVVNSMVEYIRREM